MFLWHRYLGGNHLLCTMYSVLHGQLCHTCSTWLKKPWFSSPVLMLMLLHLTLAWAEPSVCPPGCWISSGWKITFPSKCLCDIQHKCLYQHHRWDNWVGREWQKTAMVKWENYKISVSYCKSWPYCTQQLQPSRQKSLSQLHPEQDQKLNP